MSRYLILFLLNLPFILLGILSSVTQYKLNRSTKKRLIVQVAVWLLVLIGLAAAGFIYEWLRINNKTQTEALSLFDVIQITGVVVVFYITNRSRAKIEVLEKRVQDLHQELSIRLSSPK